MSTPPDMRAAFPASELPAIAIAGRKGGQGKTTSAVSIAANLAIAADEVLSAGDPGRVVIIDADSQRGSATEWLTPQWGETHHLRRHTLADVLCSDVSIDDATWPTSVPRLSIVPGGPETAAFEQMRVPAQDFVLRDEIRASRLPCIARVIDCGPSLTVVSLNGIAAASRLVMPVRVGHLDLIGADELYGMYERIKAKLVPELEVAAIVLTAVLRSNLRVQMAAALARGFPGVPLAEIRHTIRAGEAPASHLPLALFDPDCTAAIDYWELTRILYPQVLKKEAGHG